MNSEILRDVVVEELCSAGAASFLYTGPETSDGLSNLTVAILFYPAYPTNPERTIERESLCRELRKVIDGVLDKLYAGHHTVIYSIGMGVSRPMFTQGKIISDMCNSFDVDVTVTKN